MRVTVQELNRSVLHVIHDRYNDLATLQEQLATGKRLMRPSDDPVDVASSVRMNSKMKESLQFKDNINDGMAFMGVTDTAMDSMNILMQRSRELAIQADTDTLTGNERVLISKEVEQIFRQLVVLVDTNYKGDFIFNGPQSKIPPFEINSSSSQSVDDYGALRMAYFDASTSGVGTAVQLFNGFDGSVVQNLIPGSFSLSVAGTTYVEGTDYQVDYEAGTITPLNAALAIDVTPATANYDINQVRMSFDYIGKGKNIYGETASSQGNIYRQIENGATVPINISADELITDYASGNDLIGTMIRFGQNLLTNNRPGIQNAITEMDAVRGAMLSAQTKNAARINRMEVTLERNENQYVQTESLVSQLEDAEMAETVSKFMLTQNVYNAALQSAAKIIQPSLVNFL